MNFIGELAALGTSVCFSLGSSLFTISGRRIGVLNVNRMRLLLAVIAIMGVHWVMYGQLIPINATPEQWFWMAISGFVGFVVGDALLFEGFVLVGPRLSMLMMALAPIWSVLVAWLFLEEVLSVKELIGVTITLVGVMWVVMDKNGAQRDIERRDYIIGLLYGLGGSLGQAGGLIFSKIGLVLFQWQFATIESFADVQGVPLLYQTSVRAHNFSAISGSLIRLLIAALTMWILTLFQRKIKSTLQITRNNPRAFWMLFVATITGPVLGVTLSLIALQYAPVGIVATLTSLPPVFLIPISYVVFKEKITVWAVIGTVIAFIGTAILFL